MSGVTIDRVENLGGGAIRYWYNQDGQKLADGPVVVQLVAGQVRDRAGNTNAQTTASFRLDTQPPAGALASPVPNALTSHDSGYVLVQWSDGGPAGLDDTSFDTADVTVSGVTIDRVENLGGDAIRYWYNQDGDKLARRAGRRAVSSPGRSATGRATPTHRRPTASNS